MTREQCEGKSAIVTAAMWGTALVHVTRFFGSTAQNPSAPAVRSLAALSLGICLFIGGCSSTSTNNQVETNRNEQAKTTTDEGGGQVSEEDLNNGSNGNSNSNSKKPTPTVTANSVSSPDKTQSPTPDKERVPTPPAVPKTVSGGLLNGKAISLPKPAYPPAARAVHAGGAVSVQVMVDERGGVISASAVSGHPLLRAAAESAARGAKFSPTILSGQAVKVSGVLTYNFVP